MNFIIGIIIIFGCGILAILGLRPLLENNGWTETQTTIALFAVMFVVIAIPPILITIGKGGIERIGKPFTSFGKMFGNFYFTPVGLVILILILILNVLVWK